MNVKESKENLASSCGSLILLQIKQKLGTTVKFHQEKNKITDCVCVCVSVCVCECDFYMFISVVCMFLGSVHVDQLCRDFCENIKNINIKSC